MPRQSIPDENAWLSAKLPLQIFEEGNQAVLAAGFSFKGGAHQGAPVRQRFGLPPAERDSSPTSLPGPPDALGNSPPADVDPRGQHRIDENRIRDHYEHAHTEQPRGLPPRRLPGLGHQDEPDSHPTSGETEGVGTTSPVPTLTLQGNTSA